jgi:hypothetical protein
MSKKIALCFHGQIRSWNLIKDSLKEKLIDIHKPDIFFHFWERFDSLDYHNSLVKDMFNDHGPENESILNYENYYGKFNEYSIDEILQYLKPKAFKIEEPLSDMKNTKSMFYSIEQCKKLRIEYEKRTNIDYEIIIISRIDIFHNYVFEIIENDSLNLIYRPGGCGGFNDWLIYGNPIYIDIITNIYSSFQNSDRINKPCPEGIIGDLVSSNNLNVNYINKNFDVIRKNGDRV